MPNSNENVSSIDQIEDTPKYSLLQFRWEEALKYADQKKIKSFLQEVGAENFSSNRYGHSLSNTTKYHMESLVFTEATKDPQIAVANSTRVAHWQTLTSSLSWVDLNAHVESESKSLLSLYHKHSK